ncbi:hypothetical protein EDB19DRAFT_1839440 [Suillus lakei]|nr:hypothetical protein EDB19DRAFT_1839440 [Suillus lakei]
MSSIDVCDESSLSSFGIFGPIIPGSSASRALTSTDLPDSKANQVVATRLASVLPPGNLVWIHDYHLLLVPHMFRNVMHSDHWSFRSYAFKPEFGGVQVFTAGAIFTSASAAQDASVVPRGAGGDAGGVGSSGAGDTGGTKKTFTVNSTGSTRGGKARVEKYVGIDVQRHVAAVTHRPVGMGGERVAGMPKSNAHTHIPTSMQTSLRAGIQPKLEALRVLYADKKIIIGRDELDVVKGVSQKMFLYSA